jgi:hypothetical protein
MKRIRQANGPMPGRHVPSLTSTPSGSASCPILRAQRAAILKAKQGFSRAEDRRRSDQQRGCGLKGDSLFDAVRSFLKK